jgi:hypothetical protein
VRSEECNRVVLVFVRENNFVVWFDRAPSASSTPKASLTENPAYELSGWACTMPFAG